MRTLILSLLVANQCFGALSGQTAWEVRPTVGATTNGGGFVAGAAGTDMSQFDNKNAAACTSCQSATVNISTTDGVTAGTTTITSVTGNYSSALIGNIVHVQGGTGSVASGWYEVKTVPGATSFTVDRSTGLTAGTGVSVDIGGAMSLLTTIQAVAVQSNSIFIKATGTHSSAAINLSGGGDPTVSVPSNQLIGYTSVRTDGGRVTIQNSGSAGITLLTVGRGYIVKNLDIDCNSVATCTGYVTDVGTRSYNLWIHGFTTAGTWIYNASAIESSEIGPSGTCTGFVLKTGVYVAARFNYIHDASCVDAVLLADGSNFEFNIIDTMTGLDGSSGAIDVVGGSSMWGAVSFNTVYNVNRSCMIFPGSSSVAVHGNIFANCAEYGLGALGSNGLRAQVLYDGNTYYSCTLGNRHFIDDIATNPIDGVSPYTNIYDISLANTPFTDAANANFSLNSDTAGGQLLKGTSAFLQVGATGRSAGATYLDFGALQSRYGTGSAGGGNVGVVQ